MQPNDENNQPLDTGHCMSPTVSGNFIRMAQNGNLMSVSWIIQQRTRVAAEFQQVEQKLLACNNPLALASLAARCARSNKDFAAELQKQAEQLEAKKCKLRVELREIDKKLAQENVVFEWTSTSDFASLIAISRPRDPDVAVRYLIINKNPGKSAFDLCKILDAHLCDGELPAGFFPDSWTRDCGVETFVDAYRHPKCKNRVEKMISTLKQRSP